MSHLNIILNNSGYYQKFNYPAGETQVRLTDEGLEAVRRAAQNVSIRADIRNAEDLMSLALLVDAVAAVSGWMPAILIPYLPYSRADRRFTPGDCLGLEIFSRVLDSMDAESITTWDIHNPVAAQRTCPGIVDVSAIPAITSVIGEIARNTGKITVLYPDKGAADRYVLPAEIACNTVSIKVTVLKCEKKRDAESGKFLGFTVPEDFPSGPVLIVDDICDGGGTFVGIADAIAHHGLDLNLYVTHGIFSKGTAMLFSRFSRIFSTDSFPVPEGVQKVNI